MTRPHDQIPEYERRNNFLWFVLGLHSLSASVHELLVPLAGDSEPAGSAPPARGSSRRDAEQEPPALLLR